MSTGMSLVFNSNCYTFCTRSMNAYFFYRQCFRTKAPAGAETFIPRWRTHNQVGFDFNQKGMGITYGKSAIWRDTVSRWVDENFNGKELGERCNRILDALEVESSTLMDSVNCAREHINIHQIRRVDSGRRFEVSRSRSGNIVALYREVYRLAIWIIISKNVHSYICGARNKHNVESDLKLLLVKCFTQVYIWYYSRIKIKM